MCVGLSFTALCLALGSLWRPWSKTQGVRGDQLLITVAPPSDLLICVESPEANMEHQSLTIPIYRLIRDSQQMVWILKGNSLIAVPFSNNVKPVSLSMIACRDAGIYDEKKGTPFYLGIKDQNLCLYCTEIRGQPTLQLKEKDIMNLYFEAKGQPPFLFFRIEEGSSFVFQSFSCPGWFLATSSTVGQSVTLTKQRGQTQSTNFYLEDENNI